MNQYTKHKKVEGEYSYILQLCEDFKDQLNKLNQQIKQLKDEW